MNGTDTFRALKRIDRDARVLLVTGFSIEEEARTLAGEGLLGVLQKPVAREVLVAAVERVGRASEDGR